MSFYVKENFCDLFTLRPSDLITTLTYFIMHNFCPCLKEDLMYEFNFLSLLTIF